MKHVVFDLDGTIVDHRARTYGLHREYCQSHGLEPVPPALYHRRKSAGASERQTVAEVIPAADLDAYMVWKRANIELDQALALDTPWPEMLDLLARWQTRASLVLLTSRQSEAQAVKELVRLGIAPRFTAIIATPSDESASGKQRALRGYLDTHAILPADVILVGDTECEIKVARALGAACVSVTWGIRGEPYLAALAPDGIARTVAELESWLQGRLS